MTANDLIRRILLSIGVVGEMDTPTAEQANDTFVSINQFLRSLGSEGFVTMQYTNPADDIGLDDGWEAMIQTNVAVIVAPDYGREAAASIQTRAASSKRTLKRGAITVPQLSLQRIGVLRGRGSSYGYNVFTDDYGPSYPPVIAPSPPAVSSYYLADYGPVGYVQ